MRKIKYSIVHVRDENNELITGRNYAIIRQLENGSFVGYDAVAHRNNHQKHFQIYERTALGLVKAINDSKKYTLYVNAYNDLKRNGLTID